MKKCDRGLENEVAVFHNLRTDPKIENNLLIFFLR